MNWVLPDEEKEIKKEEKEKEKEEKKRERFSFLKRENNIILIRLDCAPERRVWTFRQIVISRVKLNFFLFRWKLYLF